MAFVLTRMYGKIPMTLTVEVQWPLAEDIVIEQRYTSTQLGDVSKYIGLSVNEARELIEFLKIAIDSAEKMQNEYEEYERHNQESTNIL